MIRYLSRNEIRIIRLLNIKQIATFKDIEGVVKIENEEKYWTIFSTICSLKESNFINTTDTPSKYSLTDYARIKLKQLL